MTASMADSQQLQTGQAARGSALNIVGVAVSAVANFATVTVVTNAYGAVDSGVFFTAIALFSLAAASARMGGESSLVFFIARLRADQRHSAIESVVRTAVLATIAVSLLLSIIGFTLSEALAGLLIDDELQTNQLATMIRVLALAAPFFALSQVLCGASRGFGTMRPSVLSNQIIRPVTQLVLVAIAAAAAMQVSSLAYAWLVAAVASMTPVALWIYRRVARSETDERHGLFDSGEYWRYSGIRAVADVVAAALERLDLLLVAYFLTEADVGVYGAAGRLILIGQLIMFATSQALAPHMSAGFRLGRSDDVNQLIRNFAAWNVLALWPAFLLLLFEAETLLQLFGDDFAEGVVVVRVFAVAMMIIVGLGFGDTLLLMTGHSLASLVNHIVALILVIVLSVGLIPPLGLLGAAIAWAASRITLRLSAVGWVWRSDGVHGLSPRLMAAMLITVASYAPLAWVTGQLGGNSLVRLIILALGGFMVQCVLCLIFRRTLAFDQLSGIVDHPKLGRLSRLFS